MLRITLRGLRAHIVRFLLTGVAIVLGITFLVGSFVITDTIKAAFDDLFAKITSGTDAVVQGVRSRTLGGPDNADLREPIPQSVLDAVRTVPGVANAVGDIQTQADQPVTVIGRDGKAIGGAAGTPQFAFNWSDDPTLNPWRITQGRPPRLDTEIVVDAATAREGHLVPGTRVLVNAAPRPATRYTLVGVARFGRVDRPLGATGALFTTREVQRITGLPGRYQHVLARADPGVSATVLHDRIAARLRLQRVEVLTGAQYRTQQSDAIRKALNFLYIFLTVFGAVGLLVGGFIIFNTFTIVLAQRTRELALLRAIGASPSQVRRSVRIEAFVVGLLGSAIGVAGGIGLAVGLRAILDAVGLSLPGGSVVVQPRTVALGLIIGTVVTVTAAFVPSRRAARIAPVAAMRESAIEQPLPLRRRAITGCVTTAIGVAALLFGLFSSIHNNTLYAAFGALAVFAGVFIVSPVLIAPFIGALGAPIQRFRGITGRLARDNARRNPRRSAFTAVALTLGVALVGFITIVGASFKQTISTALDTQLGATDYFISSSSPGGTLSPDVTKRVAAVPDVDVAIGIGFAPMRIEGVKAKGPGDPEGALAVDVHQVGRFVKLGTVTGNLGMVDDNGIAVSRSFADDHHLHVGSQLHVHFDKPPVRVLEVRAIFEKRVFNRVSLLVTHHLFDRVAATPVDFFSLAILRDGVALGPARHSIKVALRDYPTATVQDFAAFKNDQEHQIDQGLALIYGLLGLSIIIALIGIVNTLALSVHERTHEIGLLRAVGASRRQIRTSIRWESVLIATFGTLLGLAMGLFFGWVLVVALHRNNVVTRFDPALARLVQITLIAAAAGVLAAVFPAWRAARLDVLDAIRVE